MNKRLHPEKTYIGTSGWSYDHWEGSLYTGDIKAEERLGFYSDHFNTVEINNSFYRLPTLETFKKWAGTTPDDFIFSVKVSRYITHIRRLKDCSNPVNKLLRNAEGLEEKLGPFLVQMPANFCIDIERLKNFLDILPKDRVFVFEFRDRSWFDDRVFDLLQKHDCGTVISDAPDFPKTESITGDVCYVRMHGRKRLYKSYYQKRTLKKLKDFLHKNKGKYKKVFVYFNNDFKAHAVKDAKKFIDIVNKG